MWFLARSKDEQVVMLDEPDVYMHPDLQRRLIRFLRGRFPQLIVTTHSVAMLSEIRPDEALTVDRRQGFAGFADSLPTMQTFVDQLGGGHSLQFSRLWEAKKLLLLEGDDMQILGPLHTLIFPDSLDSLRSVTNFEIHGWGGWNYVVGSAMLLKNAVGETVSTYCILDSDYHTPQEIEARLDDAKTRNVRLHVWSRKEIESYLLVPRAIKRTIEALSGLEVRLGDVERKMNEFAESLKDEVLDCYSDSFAQRDRGKGLKPANANAREIVNREWAAGRALHRVPPKEILSKLSDWSKAKYGSSFSIGRLLQHLRREEIAEEVVEVITAIESNDALPPSTPR
jgi:hypothetical protein